MSLNAIFAGRIISNHNQTIVRKPAVWPQHNQTVVRPKPVLTYNHNQTLVRR